ncbi:MAG: fibronectin type III domain-containing protein [Holophagaceae bacterium]|nr:fibronectin type III domain-containing protein [Holophagaceae bacterium]
MPIRFSLPTLGRIALSLCGCALVLPAAGGPRPKDVTGTRILTRITTGGETPEPQDLSTATLAAHVPGGLAGYTTIPGTGAADGTFVVPAVPSGSFWFQFNSIYVWTQHHKLDLDAFVYGRANAAPALNPTSQVFAVTGLAPWAATDILQWYSTNVTNAYGYLGDYGPAQEPLPGDTALAGYNLDWSNTGFPLVDTAQGDGPSLTQLKSVVAGAETYNTLSGIFQPAALTQVDGLTNTLNGTMIAVPQNKKVRLAWTRSLSAGFQPQVNPAALPIFQRMSVHTPPWGVKRGFIAATVDLVNAYPALGTTDLDLGEARYGNPFDASWKKVYSITDVYRVNYLAPGATTARPLNATLATNARQKPTQAAPMAQSVGPVTGLTIAGSDGFIPQAGLGLTPVLAWNAPGRGNPSVYSVAVYRVFAQSGITRFAQVGTCLTRETSLTMPPALLQPGQNYVFRVRAVETTIHDSSKVIFRNGTFPSSTAEVLSAMVSTAP